MQLKLLPILLQKIGSILPAEGLGILLLAKMRDLTCITRTETGGSLLFQEPSRLTRDPIQDQEPIKSQYMELQEAFIRRRAPHRLDRILQEVDILKQQLIIKRARLALSVREHATQPMKSRNSQRKRTPTVP